MRLSACLVLASLAFAAPLALAQTAPAAPAAAAAPQAASMRFSGRLSALNLSCQQQGGTFEEYATPSGEIDPESCANTEWNVRSTVSDPSTHTEVALNQGVAVVAFGNQVSSQCK